MANGNPFQRLGAALQGFAAGIEDPGFAAREAAEQRRLDQQNQQFEQRQSAAQNEMRLALLQNALQNLPEGHSARPALEQRLGELSGIEGIGAGFAAAPAEPEFINIPIGGRVARVDRGPEGAELSIVAEGQQPREKTEKAAQSLFGSSQAGLAMNYLVRATAKRRRGEELSPDEQDIVEMSRQVLSRPQLIRGPGGELTEASPIGVPPGMDQVLSAGAAPDLGTTPGGTPIQSFEQQKQEGRFKLTTLREGAKKVKNFDQGARLAIDNIREVYKLLNAGAQERGGITGPVGSLKAGLSGLAQEVGIPTSTRARDLRKRLEELKFLVAGPVFDQPGRALSDGDRKVLDQIIGTVDSLTSDDDIRSSMQSLTRLLKIMNNVQTTE